ncbi:hypothetical protein GCM10010260_81140 [Streptomyces filipinensis]|uniref:Transposase IS4-like domain-containing protein n=1 Tax=Streptomyces filipinensis TaxID=66887 RepID=A0A918IMK7_9ACTN|nr:hypothetical protein GCM10010260_81140 [Streptomyces filipinensis]
MLAARSAQADAGDADPFQRRTCTGAVLALARCQEDGERASFGQPPAAAGDPSTAGADANGTRAPDPDGAALRRRRRARADAAGLGRSRDGLSSKIHAAADATGLPLSFVLTPGQAGDSPQFQTVLGKIRISGPVGRPRTRPEAIAADRAYSSKGNRAHLRRRRITAVIPEKIDQQANWKKKGSLGALS